jgi:hypothetical protein
MTNRATEFVTVQTPEDRRKRIKHLCEAIDSAWAQACHASMYREADRLSAIRDDILAAAEEAA